MVHELYHDVPHGSPLVLAIGGDNDIDIFHNTLEGLEELIWLQLQLQQGPVHLVHHENWFDALGDGLPENSLSLHAHTCHGRQTGESG